MESPAVLIKNFQALQEERVHTYRSFDEGFQAYLSTAPDYDFTTYRQMVHEITQAFSSLSQRIIEIQNKLSTHESLTKLAACISNIQALEQTKLEQTAQLQIATQNAVDHPEEPVCAASVAELKQLLVKTVADINDQLDDLKYEAEGVLCPAAS